jgi:hypothetical protein
MLADASSIAYANCRPGSESRCSICTGHFNRCGIIAILDRDGLIATDGDRVALRE